MRFYCSLARPFGGNSWLLADLLRCVLRDNLYEKGGGVRNVKRRPVAGL